MNLIEGKQLINKIQAGVLKSGIETDSLITNFKALREFAREEKNPTLVKLTRLTYEHLEEYDGFHIPIPADEPVEEVDGDEVAATPLQETPHDPVESLNYMLSAMLNPSNKINQEDIQYYKHALIAFSEEN